MTSVTSDTSDLCRLCHKSLTKPPQGRQPTPDGAPHHGLDVAQPVLDILAGQHGLLEVDDLPHSAHHVDELAVLVDVDVVDACGLPLGCNTAAVNSADLRVTPWDNLSVSRNIGKDPMLSWREKVMPRPTETRLAKQHLRSTSGCDGPQSWPALSPGRGSAAARRPTGNRSCGRPPGMEGAPPPGGGRKTRRKICTKKFRDLRENCGENAGKSILGVCTFLLEETSLPVGFFLILHLWCMLQDTF